MFIASGLISMVADVVVTGRVVMAAGPLSRGEDAVVGEVVAASAGYSTLRLVVRCSRASIE